MELVLEPLLTLAVVEVSLAGDGVLLAGVQFYAD